MANTIKIDPRLILPWTTGTQYRVVVTEGLVNEVGNNRTPSPFTTSTISTFQNVPTVVSTVPANAATEGFLSTATLTYTRPLYISTGTNNFYLYQEAGATDTLIATIPTTSTRVTQVGKTVTVSLRDLLVPERTYYLTADANLYTDLFKFNTPAITNDTIFKYTPGPAADIISITPTYGQENSFVNSATITYNRSLSVQTGNYYLNSTATGVVRTFDVTTLPVVTGTNSIVRITFPDLNLPEGEYFLTNDQGVFKDQHNFPILAVNNNSEMKWFNTSISNMTSRPYRGEQPTAIFTGTVPQVLDIDISTATQYTFTLSSPIGEFSSPLGGTDAGSYWTFTGTKSQLNSLISSIIFTSNDIANPNSTYTYSLEKNGVVLVNKERTLQGVLLALGALGPTGKAFPRLNLTIGGNTTINEAFTLTAVISTSTQLRGTLQFKEGNTVFSSTQISSSGTAITTVNYATTGSRSLSVSWLADELINNFAYEPLDSFDTRIFVDTAAKLPGNVVASVENIPSLRVPAGPEIILVGELPGTFDFGGIVTFKSIVEETTVTNYVDTVSINITNVGYDSNIQKYYIDVDNVYDLTSSTWVRITATVSQVGSIESNYLIKEVSGNRVIFETRSEDDNLYYGYDPLRDEVNTPNLVTLNPIVKEANLVGSRVVRQSETILTTASVINNVAKMPMSFVNSGTYKFVADWGGRGVAPKYFAKNSLVSTLIIDERAQYDGNLLVTPTPNPVHQLSTATINIVGTINTATTGTVRLIEVLGNTSTVLATSAFPGTNTFNFVLNPNNFATSASNHVLKISWDGQEWVPNEYFPYYPKDSNTVTQTVELAQLDVTVDPLNTVNLLTKIVATANTSSARAGFVQFYRNNSAYGSPVATVNNSATIENFVSAGTSTFRATWLDTFPLVNSNTATTRVAAYQSPRIGFTRSTNTFVYYNQDETVNATNIIINTLMTGTVSTRPPEGNITIVDSILGAINTSTVTSRSLTESTSTSIWNPFTQGQTLGIRNLSIVYSGDDWNSGVTTSTTISLIKPTPSFVLSKNTSTVTLGRAITFTATAPTGTKLSGPLRFTLGGVVQDTTFVDNTATIQIVPSLGTSNVIANYAETTFHNAASASTSTVTVLPYNRANITATINPTSYYNFNQDGTLTANLVTATVVLVGPYLNHPPTGNVVISDSVLGEIATTALVSTSTGFTSTAVVSFRPLTVGMNNISNRSLTVSYAGDDWSNSTSTVKTLSILKRLPTLAFSITSTDPAGVNTFYTGDNVTLTAVQTGTNITGTIVFRNLTLGTTVGTATFTGTTASIIVPLGNTENGHQFRAVWAGDDVYDSVNSNTITVTVTRRTLPNVTLNWKILNRLGNENSGNTTVVASGDSIFLKTTNLSPLYADSLEFINVSTGAPILTLTRTTSTTAISENITSVVDLSTDTVQCIVPETEFYFAKTLSINFPTVNLLVVQDVSANSPLSTTSTVGGVVFRTFGYILSIDVDINDTVDHQPPSGYLEITVDNDFVRLRNGTINQAVGPALPAPQVFTATAVVLNNKESSFTVTVPDSEFGPGTPRARQFQGTRYVPGPNHVLTPILSLQPTDSRNYGAFNLERLTGNTVTLVTSYSTSTIAPRGMGALIEFNSIHKATTSSQFPSLSQYPTLTPAGAWIEDNEIYFSPLVQTFSFSTSSQLIGLPQTIRQWDDNWAINTNEGEGNFTFDFGQTITTQYSYFEPGTYEVYAGHLGLSNNGVRGYGILPPSTDLRDWTPTWANANRKSPSQTIDVVELVSSNKPNTSTHVITWADVQYDPIYTGTSTATNRIIFVAEKIQTSISSSTQMYTIPNGTVLGTSTIVFSLINLIPGTSYADLASQITTIEPFVQDFYYFGTFGSLIRDSSPGMNQQPDIGCDGLVTTQNPAAWDAPTSNFNPLSNLNTFTQVTLVSNDIATNGTLTYQVTFRSRLPNGDSQGIVPNNINGYAQKVGIRFKGGTLTGWANTFTAAISSQAGGVGGHGHGIFAFRPLN